MQELPPNGAMVAIYDCEERLPAAIAKTGSGAAIAAVNHPGQTVISGQQSSVAAVAGLMETEGVEIEWLRAYHGYHSPEMRPMVEALVSAARGVSFQPPRIAFVSTMTGKPLPAGKALEPEYWTPGCGARALRVRSQQSQRASLQRVFGHGASSGPGRYGSSLLSGWNLARNAATGS